MNRLYSPKFKIAVASSFEGIVNNGATECALTSFNAYKNMTEGQGKFFDKLIEPENFHGIRNHEYVQAFLALRPLVGVAEDYLTVLEVIDSSPEEIRYMLEHPNEETSYTKLIDKFNDLKVNIELRERFGKGNESKFYRERARMRDNNLKNWLATQEPYKDSIEEFRKMIRTQKRDPNVENVYKKVLSGFVPWFATSKDEYSTKLLCEIYTDLERVPSDFTSDSPDVSCVINNERLIGKETVPDRDKIKQLKIVAEREGLPHSQVWRLNDTYKTSDELGLRDAGFHNQFIVPGYMFPHDIEKAKNDKSAIVLERNNFASQLAQYAKEWGF